ncbi:hypothetical protein HKX48_005777 [Thoreauomyces humboldtii]|nr:hypothetical protein HKX48_005777 [Thoreauomyces humboldtii]
MGAAYTLRPAVEADVPALRDIYDYQVKNGVATFDYETPSLEERKSWFRNNFGPAYPCIVAVDAEGAVAGYCGIYRFNAKRGYDRTVEVTLYIHHEHHRRGLGKKLLERVLGEAKAIGYKDVMALIASENAASVMLFEKFGFKPNGVFPGLGFKFGRELDVIFAQLKF